MLGLNGLVVKTHGSSKAVEVKNAILQCIVFTEQDINGKIRANIAVDAESKSKKEQLLLAFFLYLT
jgi:glycerol-3-phosphate acyltransferase PlsX